jgi:hypothetical protein
LRIKERENKTIFTSEQSQSIARLGSSPRPILFPDILLRDFPKKFPALTKRRECFEYGGGTPCSQLKTNLEFGEHI